MATLFMMKSLYGFVWRFQVITFCALVAFPSCIGLASDLDGYTIDWDNPSRLVANPPRVEMPDQINIYVTGPRKYMDMADTPQTLSKSVPAYSTTNETQVADFIAILRVHGMNSPLTDIPTKRGYTYHVLLLWPKKKTVMHFRVFHPTDLQTTWCNVFPRSSSGFVYD